MTFKDLIRLLRRRWLPALAVSVLFSSLYAGWSWYSEKPSYRARARVIISTPPLWLGLGQGTQWISVDQLDVKTWYSIVSSREIRERALKILQDRRKAADVRPEWIASAQAVPEAGSQLVWIEAVAPSAAVAADIANAVARATEDFGREIHGGERRKAQERLEDRRGREQQAEAAAEEAARAARDEARARLGSEALEVDVRRLEEEIVSHDARRRELDRRLATHKLRIERLRSDRSMAEHLSRAGAPRLGTASAENRVQESPVVLQVQERIELLHRELLAAQRRYTDEHPTVGSLRDDLCRAQLDLTRARLDALGRDIDREELNLRTEAEVAAIELRVLEPELKGLRDRLAGLLPYLDRVKTARKASGDADTRAAALDAQIAQLTSVPETSYVRPLDRERATPEDAALVKMPLKRSLGVAVTLSVIMGISFAFLLEFVDTSIRNDYDVRRHLDFPVLAVVPKVRQNEVLTLQPGRAGIMAEIFDTLATVLVSTPTDRPSRVFMVTGTNPQEGKTAVSINLAAALARQGRRTLLIDGDMRVPSIHAALALPNTAGLSELLGGVVTPGTDGVLQESEIPNLKILTSGAPPANPYELLDPARIAPIAALLREQFDAIVIDTPPVLRTGDALKLSTVADTTIFVVEAGKTDVRQATWSKRLLMNVGARIAGVVLNRAVTETDVYYYQDPVYSRKELRAT